MKKNKLLPCPWCGEIPEIIKTIYEDFSLIHRCKVIGPIVLNDSDKKWVTSRWNKRYEEKN